MVERDHRPELTLFTGERLSVGSTVTLEEDAAHHARVRRARAGDAVRLVDGSGGVASGTFESIGKQTTVSIDDVSIAPRPPALDVIVPVADRDRMLMAAEKCVELQVTGWRPAFFARSRSVSPRGEGGKFREKILARMRSALEQSRGGWLPEVHGEGELTDVVREIPESHRRFVLDQGGEHMSGAAVHGPCAIAVGPEGGYDSSELDALRALGWRAVSLGSSVLRFETAIIAAVAVIRTAQQAPERG